MSLAACSSNASTFARMDISSAMRRTGVVEMKLPRHPREPHDHAGDAQELRATMLRSARGYCSAQSVRILRALTRCRTGSANGTGGQPLKPMLGLPNQH